MSKYDDKKLNDTAIVQMDALFVALGMNAELRSGNTILAISSAKPEVRSS